MKYKVLVNNRFGEGWKEGDIVDMDENASRKPLEEGAIEVYLANDESKAEPKLESEPEIKAENPKKKKGRPKKKI